MTFSKLFPLCPVSSSSVLSPLTFLDRFFVPPPPHPLSLIVSLCLCWLTYCKFPPFGFGSPLGRMLLCYV
jgi:hypothetical protein